MISARLKWKIRHHRIRILLDVEDEWNDEVRLIDEWNSLRGPDYGLTGGEALDFFRTRNVVKSILRVETMCQYRYAHADGHQCIIIPGYLNREW